MRQKELLFVPLGGTGEIGMNLNLYAYNGQWIMVDLGISFADDHLPGVEVIMPDPAFIEERRDKLLGLFVTHAHEDHVGAVAHLWPRLRCPVYATPFTVAILRAKLQEVGLHDVVPVHEVALGGSVALGPFTVEYVSLTHSIPEPNALLIGTPAGRIFHTGDWKLDPDPLVGEAVDEAQLKAIGDAGVLAMVCDSTNVFNVRASGSEAAVRESLRKLLEGRDGRILVTTFASNVARLDSIGAVATELGRHVCLVGRSMQRNVEVARKLGYLPNMPTVLDDNSAAHLPRDKVLYISTGCQGEARAALHRIATGQHKNVVLSAGDLVVFSSKNIPGNEIGIGRLINTLAKADIDIITEKDAFVHVSGHPGQEELERMYGWIRPKIAVPVHGEARHLLKHADLAETYGVRHVVTAENGSVVRLAPGAVTIVETVDTGRLALDGDILVDAGDEAIAVRRRIMFNGYLGVAVVIDGDGRLLAVPSVDPQGISVLDHEEFVAAVREAVADSLGRLSASDRRNDRKLEEALRIATRRVARDATGKSPGPIAKVHVLRL